MTETYSEREWEVWDTDKVKNLENVWTKGPGGFTKGARHIIENKEHPIQHKGLVLDAGCGTGCFHEYLSSQFKDYVGIDSSPNMVKRAKEINPKGDFRVDDLYNLSFEVNTFDFVFCHAILNHLPEIGNPIREMYRVAKHMVFFNCWTAPEDTLHKTDAYYHGVADSEFENILESLNPKPENIVEFQKSSKPIVLTPDKSVWGHNFYLYKK